MLSGEKINVTEDRAVLHTALRAPRASTITVDGENVVDQVHEAPRSRSTSLNECPLGRMDGDNRSPHRNRG